MTEHVILLHGIASVKESMLLVAQECKKAGYIVHNMGYASLTQTIEQSATHTYHAIENLKLDKAEKLHLICHSMGGLVAFEMLGRHTLPNIGRIVTMGTPFKGSPVADFLSNKPFDVAYTVFYGPAGRQLRTDYRKMAKILIDRENLELGTIAGNKDYNYFFFRPLFRDIGDNDGLVTPKSATIKEARDHIVIPHTHTSMLLNAGARQAVHFLQKGVFKHG